MFDFDVVDLSRFTFGDGAELVFSCGYPRLPSVDGEPAWFDKDFSCSEKCISDTWVLNACDTAGIEKFGVTLEDGEETLGDEVKELFCGFIHFYKSPSGNDGEVI